MPITSHDHRNVFRVVTWPDCTLFPTRPSTQSASGLKTSRTLPTRVTNIERTYYYSLIEYAYNLINYSGLASV